MAQAIPYIAIAATVGGTAGSIIQQRRATRAQEEADQVGQRSAEIANQRRLRQNLLRSRALQAQVIAQGQAQQGGFQGSTLAGAQGSIATQGAADAGFLRTQMAGNTAINRLSNQARGASQRAAEFGALASLPSQFGFDIASSFQTIADNRDGNPLNPPAGTSNT